MKKLFVLFFLAALFPARFSMAGNWENCPFAAPVQSLLYPDATFSTNADGSTVETITINPQIKLTVTQSSCLGFSKILDFELDTGSVQNLSSKKKYLRAVELLSLVQSSAVATPFDWDQTKDILRSYLKTNDQPQMGEAIWVAKSEALTSIVTVKTPLAHQHDHLRIELSMIK